MSASGQVLVVDDDEMLARTLADVLAIHGYEARTASNGARALALSREMHPTIAVVDLRLPDMDGLDLASRIHADARDVQIVILTGNASVETAIRALRDENCEYLVKPVDPDALVRVLRAADDRRRLRSTEEALQRSRDLARAVFAASPLPIVVYDAAGRVSLWNPAAERLFGWSEAEVLNRPYGDVLEDRDATTTAQAAAVRRGESFVGIEVQHRNKAGGVLDLRKTVSSVPAEGGGEPNVLVIFEDVTERRRMDQELRDAQRLDQIGHLAGGVAHDFNNLLTVIMTQSEMSLSDETLAPGSREAFADILSAAKAGSDLTRQLLTFARRSPVEVTNVDVNKLVRETERLFGKLVGDRVVVRTNLAPDTGETEADRSQLEQVIANLFVNARDAMPDGGTLTVSTRHHWEPPGGNASLAGREWIVMAVADTGTGIADEVRERIFEPFFTTKPRGKGTGLGLATCYGVVQRFGGIITVDSAPNAGATFQVYLPRIADRTTPPRGVKSPVPSGRSGVVLVVDDQPEVRAVTTRVLERDGYVVHAAESGAAAIEAAAALAKDSAPDIVIVDVNLPDGDGRDFAVTIRKLLPRAAIMLASGALDTLSEASAGMQVLEKPFSVGSLSSAVREAMARRPRA